MKYANSRDLGMRLLEVLGLESAGVKSIFIAIDAGEAPTVTVKSFVLDRAAGGIVDTVARYKLVQDGDQVTDRPDPATIYEDRQ